MTGTTSKVASSGSVYPSIAYKGFPPRHSAVVAATRYSAYCHASRHQILNLQVIDTRDKHSVCVTGLTLFTPINNRYSKQAIMNDGCFGQKKPTINMERHHEQITADWNLPLWSVAAANRAGRRNPFL
jgi:hypothetical protein